MCVRRVRSANRFPVRHGCSAGASVGSGWAGGFAAVLVLAGWADSDGAFDGVAEICPQMPPVRDLPGVGGAAACSVGVGTGSVPADHLDAGMVGQPGHQAVGFPVGEQVDRPVGVQVDQDRSVDMTTTHGEVVDPEGPHHIRLRVGQRPDPADQGVPADRQAQRGGQPRSRTSGQRQADVAHRYGGWRGEPGMRAGQALDLLGERHGRAGGLGTAEPAHEQVHHQPRPAERGVDEPAPVPAVHPPGHRRAPRARHLPRSRVHPQPYPVRRPLDPVDHDVRQMRQHDPEIREITPARSSRPTTNS